MQLLVAQPIPRRGGSVDHFNLKNLIAVLQMTLDGRILRRRVRLGRLVGRRARAAAARGRIRARRRDVLGLRAVLGGVLDDPAAAARCSAAIRIRARSPMHRSRRRTEHLVLSTTLADVTWPSARIVRSIEEIRTLQARRPRHRLRRWRADADREPARRGTARRAPSDRPPDRRRSGSEHHRTRSPAHSGWSSSRPNGPRADA